VKTPGALEQACTTKAGGGLIAIEMQSGKTAHQSPSFQLQGSQGKRLEPIRDAPSMGRTRALEESGTGTAASRPAVLKPLNPQAAKQYMQVSVRGRNAMRFCLCVDPPAVAVHCLR